MPAVKICGLTEPDGVDQAVRLGAAYTGFVFYPPSPRSLSPAVAAQLVARLPPEVQSVAVMVDPSDDDLDAVLAAVPLDLVQLHGAETPERVAAVALRTGCRVMKALRITTAEDVAAAGAFEAVADLLLFDAKLPAGARGLPGGNGLAFDWRLLAGRAAGRPWALAGGLNALNIARAVELIAPPILDVSSGVEARPGIKDPAKLDAFFAALRAIDSAATSSVVREPVSP